VLRTSGLEIVWMRGQKRPLFHTPTEDPQRYALWFAIRRPPQSLWLVNRRLSPHYQARAYGHAQRSRKADLGCPVAYSIVIGVRCTPKDPKPKSRSGWFPVAYGIVHIVSLSPLPRYISHDEYPPGIVVRAMPVAVPVLRMFTPPAASNHTVSRGGSPSVLPATVG
jgi:hypothetical protein